MSEILGVLFKYLLALLAITAVVVVLYEALGSDKTSTAVSDVTTLQANVNQLYAGTNSSSLTAGQVLTNTLAAAGTAPSDMISGAGSSATLIDPWGGAVTVTASPPTTGATPTPAQAIITLASVPNSACAKIVGTLFASMTSVAINGGAAVSSAPAAIAECGLTPASGNNPAAGATSNSIALTFTLS